MATTGMNEYWMNALNQPQNSQSSFGTMKNGTKIGPSSAQTALAIRPKAIDGQRNDLRKGDEQQQHPVDQVRQNRPGVRLDEVVCTARRSAR